MKKYKFSFVARQMNASGAHEIFEEEFEGSNYNNARRGIWDKYQDIGVIRFWDGEKWIAEED